MATSGPVSPAGLADFDVRCLLHQLTLPVFVYRHTDRVPEDWVVHYLNPASQASVSSEYLNRRLGDAFPFLLGTEFLRLCLEFVSTGKSGYASVVDHEGQPGVVGGHYSIYAVPLPGHYLALVYHDNRQTVELEALRTLSDRQNLFTAHISHELRTPLHSLTLGLDVLEQDVSLTTVQRRQMETLRQSTLFMRSILNSALNLLELQDSQKLPAYSWFQLHPLVYDVVGECRFQYRVQVSCVFHDCPEQLYHDAGFLRSVLFHLVSNGAKYHRGPLPLEVQMRSHEDDPGRSGYLLEVRDAGSGICRDDVEFGRSYDSTHPIFGRFARGQSYVGLSGVGLGLYICRELVARHGGTLGFTSTATGTTFRFTWPAVSPPGPEVGETDPSQAPVSPSEPVPPWPQPATVLVVDDNRPNLKFLARFLERMLPPTVRILTAENGQEALTLFQAHLASVVGVFMDYRMPVMNGLESLRAMRQLSPPCDVFYVMVSANVHSDDEKVETNTLTQYQLPKPVTRAQLKDCLSHWGVPRTSSCQ